jgi:hypothetical protein
MYRRGGTRQMMVVCTRARLLEPRLAMALYNKNRRILYYKAEKPLLKRHLIKYKAY